MTFYYECLLHAGLVFVKASSSKEKCFEMDGFEVDEASRQNTTCTYLVSPYNQEENLEAQLFLLYSYLISTIFVSPIYLYFNIYELHIFC